MIRGRYHCTNPLKNYLQLAFTPSAIAFPQRGARLFAGLNVSNFSNAFDVVAQPSDGSLPKNFAVPNCICPSMARARGFSGFSDTALSNALKALPEYSWPRDAGSTVTRIMCTKPSRVTTSESLG